MRALARYCRLVRDDPLYTARMGFVKGRSALPLDFHLLRSGRAFAPVHLTLEVTHQCNLACHMCDLFGRGEPIDSIRSRREKPGGEFSVVLLEKLCAAFGVCKPVLSFGGGEPLLHPQIAALVRYAKQAGHIATLTTNGTLLEKYGASLADAGLDNLVISIDGPEAVHDGTRGVPGAFRKARAGSAALRDYRRARRLDGPRIRINCTINSRNFSFLSEVIAIAEEFGADSLVFSHLWFWDREAVEAHNRVLGDLCPVVEQNTDEIDRIHPGRLNEEIIRIKKTRTPLVVKFLPDLSGGQVVRYYTERARPVSRGACRAAWLTAFIMPDGDVIPCLDYRYGNLGEQSFSAIWNGERARSFRRRLRASGIFPACARCCLLYAF